MPRNPWEPLLQSPPRESAEDAERWKSEAQRHITALLSAQYNYVSFTSNGEYRGGRGILMHPTNHYSLKEGKPQEGFTKGREELLMAMIRALADGKRLVDATGKAFKQQPRRKF